MAARKLRLLLRQPLIEPEAVVSLADACLEQGPGRFVDIV
jgi:hypothetical protein